MKILLVGHAGVFNRGCEAIVRSTILMLKRDFADLQVTLASFDYRNDRHHDFGFPVKVIPHITPPLREKLTWAGFVMMVQKRLKLQTSWRHYFSTIKQSMLEADVVLSVGGDNYTEDYGLDSLRMYLALNKYIKSFGKKLLIWGASVGGFTERGDSLGVVENLKKIDRILLREEVSYQYLIRLGMDNISLVADPAFLLPLQAVDLPSFLKNKEKTLLGFNISPLLRRYRTQLDRDKFMDESIAFLSEVLLKGEINVLLLPHVNDGNKGQCDDYEYLRHVYDVLPNKERVYLAPQNLNAEQLKFLISHCDYYFGARTHSTIAALSSFVPTISIGYSEKAKGINQSLFDHLLYLLPMDQFNSSNLSDKLELLKRQKHIIKNILAARIPVIQKMSWNNLEVLKGILAC